MSNVSVLVLSLATAFVATAAPLAAQSLPVHVQIEGVAAGGRAGWSLCSAGDVDGDGFDDLLVGALAEDLLGLGAGSARVLSGLDGSELIRIDGTSFQQQLGFSVASLGDLDGDGTGDLAVGANLDDGAGTNAGRVLIVSGMTGGIIRAHVGDAPFDQMGFAIAGIGDVDGDLTPDYLVSAPRDDTNGSESGMVRVHSGATGAEVRVHRGQAAGDLFGFAVTGVGDWNQDGAGDYAIGAPAHDANGLDAGRVTVHSGADGALLGTLDGGAAGFLFGTSLSGRGDVDADGVRDLAVGAIFGVAQGVAAGTATVYSGAGGAVLLAVAGTAFDDRLGQSVDLGDLDADGHADLFAGAPLADVFGLDFGLARAWSGADGTLLASFGGDTTGGWFGKAVAILGDVNGDGLRDGAVGAPFRNGTASQAGRARAVAFGGARPYGIGTGALQLAWLPGLPASPHQGAIRCEGAGPFAAGLALVSLAPAQGTVLGLPLLATTDPALLITLATFGYDGQGRRDVYLDLAQPVLAGTAIYAQFFADGQALEASNGLELLFAP